MSAKALVVAMAVALWPAGCAAGKAFRQGEVAMRDRRPRWRRGVLSHGRTGSARQRDYKIALQRAMQRRRARTSRQAKEYEQQDQLEAALGEYKLAREYDPTQPARLVQRSSTSIGRSASALEAARPKPAIESCASARARRRCRTPLLNFTSRAAAGSASTTRRCATSWLHRPGDRHQHHVRPAVPGSATTPCSSTASRSSRRSTRF